MKRNESRAQRPRTQRLRRLAGVAAISLLLVSCGGGSGDGGTETGGIIGTGIMLRGTVPTNRALAKSEVEIRAASGERTLAALDDLGRFEASDVQGSAPYLIRADLGNGSAYYGMANASGASTTQNVHAYTDLAIRNWFATNGLDIDSQFASSSALSGLPGAAQLGAINGQINALIQQALEAYGLGTTDLNTVAFTANDAGVDNFLDRNPVLINNGNITIIISEPQSSTQSVVSQNLPLNTDLTGTDSAAPSAPDGLRVLPSALDEIVLAWNDATDNIGVTSYQVYRDGVALAKTAFPVFIDSPLQSGVSYTYTVTALDSSGNESIQSASGSSETLAAQDTTPPPAPSGLALVASGDNIGLTWSQEQINDVASFKVLRSVSGGMVDTLAKVTSNFMTDAALNSGVEYCYQVIATDASENDSLPTAESCATTSGTVVTTAPTTPSTPTTTEPPGGQTSASLAALLAVDVSGLTCTVEPAEYTIATAVTLDEPCYNIKSSLSVREGGSLSVAAGTVLVFSSNVGIDVNQGGSLSAIGTATAPVVFTGADRTAGFWKGVTFTYSNSTKNVFNNVVIEYAGSASNTAGGLKTNGLTSAPARVSIDGLVLRHSAGNGFYLDGNTILDKFDNVAAVSNALAGRVGIQTASQFSSNSTFTGNTQEGVQIIGTAVTSNTQWQKIDTHWLVDDLSVRAPLGLAAGTEIQFGAGGELYISTDGSLKAVGSSAEPILLTGQQKTLGYWEGVEFVYSNSTNNQLEHVTIEYGGVGSNSAGLSMLSLSSSPARLSVKNVNLRFNQNAGFNVGRYSIISEFSNVVSTSNDSSGSMHPGTVASLGTGLVLTGNTEDVLVLGSGKVESSATWPALDVPYRFDALTIDAPLTLSAGTTMIAESGGGIQVSSDGSFNATGTAAMPINIIGQEAFQGSWKGIEFIYSNSGQNKFDHVVVSHGGGGNSNSNGNIKLSCLSTVPSRIAISNTSLTDSQGYGIFVSSANCSVTVGSNVTFARNDLGDTNDSVTVVLGGSQ